MRGRSWRVHPRQTITSHCRDLRQLWSAACEPVLQRSTGENSSHLSNMAYETQLTRAFARRINFFNSLRGGRVLFYDTALGLFIGSLGSCYLHVDSCAIDIKSLSIV